MIEKQYKINDYISVSLKNGSTNILVKGVEFIICKDIAISIPFKDLHGLQDIYSIDDLENSYYKKIEETDKIDKYDITPETEFLVHCSNLQVWAENGYDTKLLHSNLAFPLLNCIKLGNN